MNPSRPAQPPLARKDRHRSWSSPPGRVDIKLLLALLITTLPGGELFARTKEVAPTHGQVVEKQGDLKQLRGQIESLRKGVAAAEDKRDDAADQLKEIEQDISATQRDLRDLSEQRDKLLATLKDLGSQSQELHKRLGSQQTQLEKLVYRQYVQGQPDSLRLLLNGADPNQMARDLYYLTLIGGARRQLVGETESTLRHKQALADDTQKRAAELASIEKKHQEEHAKLLAQREQRKAVLEKISTHIADQRRQIGSLERDEKQLTQVIERLSKAIAEQAARAAKAEQEAKAAQAAQAARAAQEKKAAANHSRTHDAPKSTATSAAAPAAKADAPALNNEVTPQAMPAGDFARQKGLLRLPIRGQVSNRFGGARHEGGTWKGLFIRASTGGEVKAIAAGRVVFADWMRGFGNIVIVDHGGSYLSIYGNNEALLKQNGDSVHGGDTIATVGNSGGNPESGLYFELRHQGQPLDPLTWINLK